MAREGADEATPESELEILERQLPDDVLLDILLRARRDAGKKFLNYMGVSMQWERVARSAVSSLTWTLCTNPCEAAVRTNRYENLRSITMDRCSLSGFSLGLGWAAIFKDLGLKSPLLTSLSMLYIHPLLDEPALKSLFTNCLSLATVEFFKSLSFDLTLPAELMTSLRHLHVDSFESTTAILDPEHTHIPTLSPLTALTSLTLRNFSQYQLPPLSSLTNLRSLTVFCYNMSFEELPPLADLTLLESLDLSWCVSLSRIPPLHTLPHLRTLCLKGLDSLESFPGLERITQLRSLDISCCDSLVNLQPLTTLSHLERLSLDLKSQDRAGWVVEWLPELTALKQLLVNFSGELDIPVLRLPPGLQDLEINARSGDITGLCVEGPLHLHTLTTCSGIEYPEPALSSLSRLKVRITGDSRSWVRIIDGLGASCLHELDFDAWDSTNPAALSATSSFGSDPPVHALTSLHRLHIRMALNKEWQHPHPFAQLGGLRELSLNNCFNLEEIPALRGLGALRSLNVQSCPRLRALPSLDALPSLEEIRFSSLPSVVQLPALTGLAQLRILIVAICPSIVEIPPLAGLEALEEIWLGQCTRLAKLPPLDGVGNLRALALLKCQELERLPALGGLPRLRWLSLEGCAGLRPRAHASSGSPSFWDKAREGDELKVVQADGVAPESMFFMMDERYAKEYKRWRSLLVDGESDADSCLYQQI